MLNSILNDLTSIYTRKNIIRYFVHLTLFFLAVILFLFHAVSLVHDDILLEYYKKIKNIDVAKELDINLICNAIDCKEAYIKDTTGEEKTYNVFFNKGGVLSLIRTQNSSPAFGDNIFTNMFNSVVCYKDNYFIIDDYKYFHSMLVLTVYTFIIFFFMFTISFFIKLINEHKELVIARKSFYTETEGRLQRDLTESLNHELNMPVALVRSIIKDLYSYLYPCENTSDGICDFKKEIDKKISCPNCNSNSYDRAIDEIAIGHYHDINLAIDRITNVLNLISGSKHIKYNNGTVSLFVIIKNIIDSNNSYKVNKINVEYVNEHLLHEYATGYGLTNADMLNMLHVMVLNSMEAKASVITFKAELLTNNIINLYVADNGRGVRDPVTDKVINTLDIFNYGYSTKDDNGDKLYLKLNWKQKIIKFTGGILNSNQSTRGVGLSVNKAILEKAGGSMTLYKTSARGTIFKLTLPIKKRENENK